MGVSHWGIAVAHSGMGVADWGMGDANWGIGVTDWGMGDANWGIGDADWGVGVTDSGMGVANWENGVTDSRIRVRQRVERTHRHPIRRPGLTGAATELIRRELGRAIPARACGRLLPPSAPRPRGRTRCPARAYGGRLAADMAHASELDEASRYAFAKLGEADGDIMRLPVPLQTVAVIVSAQGMIDNGGFRYFFESDWPGKPPYSFFAGAYRRIGADDAARAFDAAIALFPFANPHESARKRNEFLDRYEDDPADPFERLSDRVCGNRLIWQRLEEYVATNGAAFRHA